MRISGAKAATVCALLFFSPRVGGTQQLTRTSFQVNTITTGLQSASDVAMLPGGGFVAVWASPSTAPPSISAQVYGPDGAPLGSELQVASPVTVDPPAVAVSATGDFVVVWQRLTLDGGDIWARRFATDGTPLGAEFEVNTYTSGAQVRPRVAMASGGDFVVAWESHGSSGPDTSGDGILAQRFASDGSPAGPEFQVNTYTTLDQRRADVSMNASGAFVVVWDSEGSFGDDVDRSIQARRFAADGMPLDLNEFQVNTYTTGNAQSSPRVAMNAAGDFVVGWWSGGSFGSDDDDLSIQARRFAADGSPFGAQFQVNSFTKGKQVSVDVATTGDGSFALVWQSDRSPASDGSETCVLAQRFAPDGSTVGSEFQVNTVAAGRQQIPAVAMSDVGTFVVTMISETSFGTDTDQGSIQGELFESDVAPCASAPLGGCIEAGGAVLKYNEARVGKEKFQITLRNLLSSVTQAQFGDPVSGATRYDLCVYDEIGTLAAGLSVDRAGDTCAGNPCWLPSGTTGYRFQDPTVEDGIAKVLLKGGVASKGKIIAKGKNKLPDAEGLPIQVAQALAANATATVQVVASDGDCFTAALSTVKVAEPLRFLAKTP